MSLCMWPRMCHQGCLQERGWENVCLTSSDVTGETKSLSSTTICVEILRERWAPIRPSRFMTRCWQAHCYEEHVQVMTAALSPMVQWAYWAWKSVHPLADPTFFCSYTFHPFSPKFGWALEIIEMFPLGLNMQLPFILCTLTSYNSLQSSLTTAQGSFPY